MKFRNLLGPLAALVWALAAAARGAEPPLATAVAASSGAAGRESFDAVVQAVRQSVVAAQVTGAIVAIEVKAGDSVRSGQELVRLDAHAAHEGVAAGEAQVRAAQASLQAATQDVERARRLFEKSYISQAALQRAEEQYQASKEQVAAQIAQTAAVRTQSDFYVLRAPYAGVIAEVPVALGDMAMPGKPLLTLYDPAAMRVTAALPQSVVGVLRRGPGAGGGSAPVVEIPGSASAAQLTPVRVQVLPTADAGTHTVEVRMDLPRGQNDLRPGMFARAWLPSDSAATRRIFVPRAAVVRQGEMTGVYIVDPAGRPSLRQIRLGPETQTDAEVLAGVSAGERVALDPQAAARIR